MKKVFGALAVVALFASCGLLNQKVNYADGSAGKDDPIGLKGKPITVSLLSGGAARLQADTQTTSGTLDDITGIPSGVSLQEWGFTLDLTTPAGGAVVTGNTQACPSSLKINVDSLTLNVKDAANAAGQSAPVTFAPSSITLTETTDCNYAVPAAPVKVSASITGAALSNLVNIITAGGQNTVTATLTTTTTPAIGGSVNLVFGSGTGFVIAGI